MKLIIRSKDRKEVISNLCKSISINSSRAIEKNGKFTIGLSGGSIIDYLCEGLPEMETEWDKWTLFFCDERVVPLDSPDSTFGAYKKKLLPLVPLLESQFVTIDQGLSAEEAAKSYEKKIKEHFGSSELPKFDLLLLGMGPDGHTCSLFPNHPVLDEKEMMVAPITDSPKPPPERITLTYPVINNAECAIFALDGNSKAEVLKRIHVDKEDLPAGRVQLTSGSWLWVIDDAAYELWGRAIEHIQACQ